MHDIKDKMTNIQKQIKYKLNHPFLHKHLQSPYIDEDKLLLLYSILADANLKDNEVEHYVLTTMLIQLALDTHEYVTNSKVNTPKDNLTKQLTVLAGDYFSGLYYYFLAQQDDISMIRYLAEGTKIVNENKIKLYQNDITQLVTLTECIEVVEVSLLRKVTDYFCLPKWNGFITKFLLLKRLLKEREIYLENGHSIIMNGFRHVFLQSFTPAQNIDSRNDEETSILQAYDIQIGHVKDSLRTFVSSLTLNSVLEQRTSLLLSSDYDYLPLKKTMEEG